MTKKLKIVLLVLLSLISVFFAEVISGSMKYPLFDIWGYFVVIPLYGLHTIILLYIITKNLPNKKIMFSVLYFAGVLFGLYEAYLTKVLWVGLSEDAFILFNISIIDYMVLVFFWHPIFSFIIPALVFERVITNTNYLYQGLPKFIRNILEKKYGLFFVMIIIGFFSAFNGIFQTLTISELSLLIPILLILLWIYRKGINNKYSFYEILPSKKGIIMSSMYLSLIYIGLGLFFKPEILTIENQIPIWLSYLVFGYLFYGKLKRNKQEDESLEKQDGTNYKIILIYCFIIVFSGVMFVVLLWFLGIKDIMLITTWILWIITGVYMLIYSLLK